MWGRNISLESQPFNLHVCIYNLFCIVPFFYIEHRKKKSSIFLQKEGPLLQCRIKQTSESVMVAYTHSM